MADFSQQFTTAFVEYIYSQTCLRSFSNVAVPVLFALAAVFYAKLGYMAFFGCCDSNVMDRFTTMEAAQKDIDQRINELSAKHNALQDEVINDKEQIDQTQKTNGMLHSDMVTSGEQRKGKSNKDSFMTAILLAVVILQICFVFGVRHLYRQTKYLEKEITKLKTTQ